MELRILTYNIFFLWKHTDPLKRADLIAEEVAGKYDFIVFTEAFDDTGRERLVALLREKGYPYITPVLHAFPTRGLTFTTIVDLRNIWRGQAINGGTFIASRWPIEYQQETLFRRRIGAERWCPKGIKYIRARVRNERIHLFGIHLQADDSTVNWWKWLPKRWSRRSFTGARVRTMQLRQTRRWIDRFRIPSHERVFIVGDMNVSQNGPEYGRMLNQLQAVCPPSAFEFTVDRLHNDFCKSPPRPGFVEWLGTNPISVNATDEFVDYVLSCRKHRLPLESELVTVRPRTQPVGSNQEQYDLSDHYAVEGRFVYED